MRRTKLEKEQAEKLEAIAPEVRGIDLRFERLESDQGLKVPGNIRLDSFDGQRALEWTGELRQGFRREGFDWKQGESVGKCLFDFASLGNPTNKATDEATEQAVLRFARRYGPLGIRPWVLGPNEADSWEEYPSVVYRYMERIDLYLHCAKQVYVLLQIADALRSGKSVPWMKWEPVLDLSRRKWLHNHEPPMLDDQKQLLGSVVTHWLRCSTIRLEMRSVLNVPSDLPQWRMGVAFSPPARDCDASWFWDGGKCVDLGAFTRSLVFNSWDDLDVSVQSHVAEQAGEKGLHPDFYRDTSRKRTPDEDQRPSRLFDVIAAQMASVVISPQKFGFCCQCGNPFSGEGRKLRYDKQHPCSQDCRVARALERDRASYSRRNQRQSNHLA